MPSGVAASPTPLGGVLEQLTYLAVYPAASIEAGKPCRMSAKVPAHRAPMCGGFIPKAMTAGAPLRAGCAWALKQLAATECFELGGRARVPLPGHLGGDWLRLCQHMKDAVSRSPRRPSWPRWSSPGCRCRWRIAPKGRHLRVHCWASWAHRPAPTARFRHPPPIISLMWAMTSAQSPAKTFDGRDRPAAPALPVAVAELPAETHRRLCQRHPAARALQPWLFHGF